MPRLTPTLRPKDFEGSSLQLTPKGLQGTIHVDVVDIKVQADPDASDVLLARGFKPVSCEINPAWPTREHLYRALRSAQVKARVDNFNIGYGDTKGPGYDLSWSVGEGDALIEEGQLVHLVCRRGRAIVGYVSVDVCIGRDFAKSSFTFHMSPNLVYVAPKYRGQGYGVAMAVATGYLAMEMLDVLYGAVPPRSMLSAGVTADFDSVGGERFANHLVAAITSQLDEFIELNCRPSVQVDREVLFDAGW